MVKATPSPLTSVSTVLMDVGDQKSVAEQAQLALKLQVESPFTQTSSVLQLS